MRNFRLICLMLAGVAVPVLVLTVVAGATLGWQLSVLVIGFGVAIGLGAVPALASYQYTGWIVACIAAALLFPGAFDSWGGVNPSGKVLMTSVIQLVMFGMATQMKVRDFTGVAREPRGVLVGLIGHYTVMPLAAVLLVQVFDLPAAVGLGVIIYGCVSSGLASNVMSLLAKANLGLAVTITAMSTILSPLMTPLLVRLAAGRLVDVSVVSMMFDVIRITLVPVAAALLVDHLRTAEPAVRRRVNIACVVAVAWLIFLAAGGYGMVTEGHSANWAGAVQSTIYVAAAVLIARGYDRLVQRKPSVARYMPYASMFGIMYYNTITTAAGRDALVSVGVTLLVIGLIHNLTGYTFGYWGARASGLDVASARAVSFEVGLQNGGMATGLATSMGMLGTAGLAAAVFSPLGNVTGSLLANYWSRRPGPAVGQGRPAAKVAARVAPQ